jgi:hypothetical protein
MNTILSVNKLSSDRLFCSKLRLTFLAVLPLFLIVFLSAPNVGVASAASSFTFIDTGQSSGQVGDSHYSFTGSGLQPNYAYDVYFDGWTRSYRGQTIARVYTDELGNIKPDYFYIAPIPQVVGGVHNVELVDVYYAATGYFDSADCGDVSFRVLPSIKAPNNVQLGANIEVIVYGFSTLDPTQNSLYVNIGGLRISPCIIQANGVGSFKASFSIPSITPGNYALYVTSDIGDCAIAVIVVTQPFVTPEYSLGALLALSACLAAFGLMHIGKRIHFKGTNTVTNNLHRPD